jgi:hypothetical protein
MLKALNQWFALAKFSKYCTAVFINFIKRLNKGTVEVVGSLMLFSKK